MQGGRKPVIQHPYRFEPVQESHGELLYSDGFNMSSLRQQVNQLQSQSHHMAPKAQNTMPPKNEAKPVGGP